MPRSPKSLLLCAAVASLAPSARGDLGAAVRRSTPSHASSAALPADAPLSSSVVVPLRRVGARPTRDGVRPSASLYVGQVSVGHPLQTLQVTFDTASGNVLLPHRGCKSAACAEHQRFSPWESSTAMDINLNGSAVQAEHRIAEGKGVRDAVMLGYAQSDLGTGNVTAVLVRDSVCIAAGACVDMGVLAATSMDDEPFRASPNDGIVGLGLESLASGKIFSFLGRLFEGSRNVKPQFGLALGADAGELHFGSHEGAPLAEPLRWFPVDHPEMGFWQVAIQAVRVGDRTVHECSKGCHGIVDTGVSHLGAQRSHHSTLLAALSPRLSESGACEGPDLSFDLGGFVLTLSAADYTDVECHAQVGSLDLEEPDFVGVFALGAGLLRRYYAAFDWEQGRLAFARMAAESVVVV